MRLIDVDALIYDEIEEGFLAVTKWRIDGAPTIEAIPVEWLKKKSSTLEEEHYYEDAVYLLQLIELWREEHETD